MAHVVDVDVDVVDDVVDAGGGGSVHPPLLTKGVLPSEAVLRFQVIPLSHHHDDGAQSYDGWLG